MIVNERGVKMEFKDKVYQARMQLGLTQIEFAKVSNISVEKVLRLIKESGGRVKLDPHKPNFLILQTGKIGLKEKSQFIREKLEFLL